MLLEGSTVGLIEDDPVMGGSVVQSLALEGSHVVWWTTCAEAAQYLRSATPDVVICDIRLPDMEGSTLFRQLAATRSLPPFLFVTAYGDIDQAVSLMREGASDYITKPFEISALIERLRILIGRHTSMRSTAALGVSNAMMSVESSLRRVRDLTSPLLLTGETGAGKEVCARFLHAISARSKEPFIAVNCAAIPADNMERELFGYRGNGAQSYHRGYAERARGGILFLDEVAELSAGLQAKLLRLVDTREFHRAGGEQQVIFHGRIVCATNRDLTALVRSGLFREDFYFRIAGMTIEVPPLRKRARDVALLVELFFQQFKGHDHQALKGVGSLALQAAERYPWPGNVRELRNRVERAVALAKSEWVMPGDLFPDESSRPPASDVSIATLSEARDDAERRQIELALKGTNGQIIEAAKLLGVSRTTLWDKMRRLGVGGAT